jgi:hypothetical protein
MAYSQECRVLHILVSNVDKKLSGSFFKFIAPCKCLKKHWKKSCAHFQILQSFRIDSDANLRSTKKISFHVSLRRGQVVCF